MNDIKPEEDEKKECPPQEGTSAPSVSQEEQTLPVLTRITDYQSAHNYIFRICLLGDSSVGKTSLLTRFCDGTFKEKYSNTIGVDFRVVTLKYEETIAKVHIWDTAGQERFKSIAINYFRSSHGFIFVYDITSQISFKDINNWIELAFSNNKNCVVNCLIGNKSDLKNKREVTTQQGEELAKMRNFFFFETSALNAENVDNLFEMFTYKLIQFYNKNKSLYEEPKKNGPKNSEGNEINTSREKKKCEC